MKKTNLENIITPFLEKNTETVFLNEGYVSFPFLDKLDLIYIKTIYNFLNSKDKQLEKVHFSGINYSSMSNLYPIDSQKAYSLILKRINEKLKSHFSNYEIFGCQFITKPPKTISEFNFHQDWNYTIESEHAFATCWVPLVDVNKNNGGICFVNKSNLLFSTYRSYNIDTVRVPFEMVDLKYRVDVSLKAGECLAFHQSTLHGSYANPSNSSRPILVFIVKKIKSPIIHYSLEGDIINAIKLTISEFNNLIGQLPNVNFSQNKKVVEKIENKGNTPSINDFLKLL